MTDPLTPEQTAEIQAAGQPISAHLRHRDSYLVRLVSSLSDFEDDDVGQYLAMPTAELCGCGAPMRQWEVLTRQCSTCFLESARNARGWADQSPDQCRCGYLERQGWHLVGLTGSSGERGGPLTAVSRCPRFWERQARDVDRKGQRVRVTFGVSSEDSMRLERYESGPGDYA